jgi:hypothetical protein
MIERDIWAAAHKMIEMFGADAIWQASLRADQLLGQGDAEGSAVWHRIVKAIGDLQRSDPGKTIKH